MIVFRLIPIRIGLILWLIAATNHTINTTNTHNTHKWATGRPGQACATHFAIKISIGTMNFSITRMSINRINTIMIRIHINVIPLSQ